MKTTLPFKLPSELSIVDKNGKSNGLIFHDLNADGKLDLIFSNEKEYGIYLFADMKTGWSKKVLSCKRGDNGECLMISRNGTNNGVFILYGHLCGLNC